MIFTFRGSVKILLMSCSPSLMLHSLLTSSPTSPQLLHVATPCLNQSTSLRNGATAEAPGALCSPMWMATSFLWGFFCVEVSNMLKIVASAHAGNQTLWPIMTIIAAWVRPTLSWGKFVAPLHPCFANCCHNCYRSVSCLFTLLLINSINSGKN